MAENGEAERVLLAMNAHTENAVFYICIAAVLIAWIFARAWIKVRRDELVHGAPVADSVPTWSSETRIELKDQKDDDGE